MKKTPVKGRAKDGCCQETAGGKVSAVAGVRTGETRRTLTCCPGAVSTVSASDFATCNAHRHSHHAACDGKAIDFSDTLCHGMLVSMNVCTASARLMHAGLPSSVLTSTGSPYSVISSLSDGVMLTDTLSSGSMMSL